MHIGEQWAPPRSEAPPPGPSPLPPAAPHASPACPDATALPTLPGGPRPEGGIVPSPVHTTDAALDPSAAEHHAPEPAADVDRQTHAPVTRAALGPSRNQRRLRGRARWAVLATLLSMGASAAAAVALLQRRAGAVELRDGGSITARELDELDDLAVLLSLVEAAVFALAAIIGVVWFRRAYRNLRSMGRNAHGPGWALAGWVVPVLNLFRPYQMAEELVRESPRERGTEGTGMVGIWWLTFLAAAIGGRALAVLPQDTLDELILNDMLRVVMKGVALIAGLAWIGVIGTVTRRQDAWFDPIEPAREVPPDGAGVVTALR